MRRLIILPILVVALVLGVPVVAGDHPLRWSTIEDVAVAQADRLPARARDLVPFGPEPRQQYVAVPPPPGATARPLPELRPVRNRYPVDTVPAVWSPGTAELGVQVYWVSNPKDRERDVWLKAQRIVDYVVGLDANSIAVSFPFYLTGISGTEVLSGRGTPPAERLEILVRQAHAAGLRVTLRPILDEAALGPPKGWRGNIVPTSMAAWFASYQAFLEPYVELAERRQVATLVVGTELNSLEPETGRWSALMDWMRARYSGEVAYDLNWDQFRDGLHPPGAGSYGVDAYFPVHADDSAPPSVIARSWKRTIATAPAQPPGPLVLSEVGIAAKRGAYRYPAAYSGIGTYDKRIQPTWYRGVCEAARARRLGGIYFWKVDFDADPQVPRTVGKPNLDFIGHREAEAAIRECLSRPWRVSGHWTDGAR